MGRRTEGTKIEIVIKRDGREVPYDKERVQTAMRKAMEDVESLHEPTIIACREAIEEKFKQQRKVHVEDIQDAVEKQLIYMNQAAAAKVYILYRKKRSEIRKVKALIGIEDDLKLPLNSLLLLSKRYLIKDQRGKIIETPKELFLRSASLMAEVELNYGKTEKEVEELTEKFFNMMIKREFMPNSPTLMNAKTRLGQLSACFVLPIDDSIDGIFKSLGYTAKIHQTGGGTGYSFSKIRPMNDLVASSGGVASGPISFMRIFNVATEVIKQGGKRRGANMGTLIVSHPDILNFINCKEHEGEFENFNISSTITDKFMKKLHKEELFELVNPRTGIIVQTIGARVIWNLIVLMAWKNGEPGVVFIDTINKHNPVPSMPIEATNPCGEQPLAPFESCNLGSINLERMTSNSMVDYAKLKNTVRLAIQFLDNVIDANKYPLKKIKDTTLLNRKIGLGVMGFADMLIKLGVPYGSHTALKIAEDIMSFITAVARQRSAELGTEKGSFPNFEKSTLKGKYTAMRNATVTTIAPTGSIGVIANCSGGIEPIFSIVYTRQVSESLGMDLTVVNPLFESAIIKAGMNLEDALRAISGKISIRDVKEIPEKIRELFVTAHDITPTHHVRMQAAFQKYTDNAVSKTINLPTSATHFDVERVYLLAYQLGCKGITVYRHGSRKKQVLCPTCVV